MIAYHIGNYIRVQMQLIKFIHTAWIHQTYFNKKYNQREILNCRIVLKVYEDL